MSRFRFVLVQGGRVTASVQASDIREATRLLRPPTGAWVTSAASFALGHAAPLPVTKCRGCGVRPRGKTSGYCTACTNARRRARLAEHSQQGEE